MVWKQCDVFPIIAEIIKQQYEQHSRFITAREISTELLLNREGRSLVEAACGARKNQESLELVASNMVAWLSARITRSETEWATAFERTRIDGRWAYKTSQT